MQAFAERLVERSRPGGIVIFTSGPPQTGAIAYAASKGVSFLVSEDAGFIDGQLITSDGGHGVADGSWPR